MIGGGIALAAEPISLALGGDAMQAAHASLLLPALILIAGLLFALCAIGFMAAVVHGGMHFAPVNVDDDFGGIDHFGRVLFDYGLVPFELSMA